MHLLIGTRRNCKFLQSKQLKTGKNHLSLMTIMLHDAIWKYRVWIMILLTYIVVKCALLQNKYIFITNNEITDNRDTNHAIYLLYLCFFIIIINNKMLYQMLNSYSVLAHPSLYYSCMGELSAIWYTNARCLYPEGHKQNLTGGFSFLQTGELRNVTW